MNIITVGEHKDSSYMFSLARILGVSSLEMVTL